MKKIEVEVNIVVIDINLGKVLKVIYNIIVEEVCGIKNWYL